MSNTQDKNGADPAARGEIFFPFVPGVACPDPIRKDPNLDNVWERHRSGISYALILVEYDLDNPRAKFAHMLLSDTPKRRNRQTNCLEEPLMLTNKLQRCIELLLSEDPDKEGEVRELLGRINQRPNLWYDSRRSMKRSLNEYYKRTFEDKYVYYSTPSAFSQRAIFKVDLGFLDDKFFGMWDTATKTLHETGIEPQPMYHSHLDFTKDVERGNMKGTLKFKQERMTSGFRYGGPAYLTSFFFNVLLPGLLRHVGAIPSQTTDEEVSQLIEDYKRLGYLYTVEENLQSPHTDVEHASLRLMSEKIRKKGSRPVTVPWSFDLAQSPNGFRLAVYGTEYPQNLTECLYDTPLDVHVYGKEMLVWRGDLVHGGCLNDPLGESGALRQHGFVPLSKEHVGMYIHDGNVTNGRLGNTSRRGGGRRYDAFLFGFGGVPFP